MDNTPKPIEKITEEINPSNCYIESKKEKSIKLNNFYKEHEGTNIQQTAEELSIRFDVSKSTIYSASKNFNVTLAKKSSHIPIKSKNKTSVAQKILFIPGEKTTSNIKCYLDVLLNNTGIAFVTSVLNSFKNQNIKITIEPK